MENNKTKQPLNNSKISALIIENLTAESFASYVKKMFDNKKTTLRNKGQCLALYIISLSKKIGVYFTKDNETIYIYNGVYNSEFSKAEMQDLLEKSGKLVDIKEQEYTEGVFIDSLQEHFTKNIKNHIDKEDKNFVAINLLNGILEIKDGVRNFTKHHNNYFFKYVLPYEYNEKAECPKFNNFLNCVLPDKIQQDILAEYFGYCITRNNYLKLEKVLFISGTGSNGKSTLNDIITSLFGSENISSVPLDMITDSKGEGRYLMKGKFINYCSELSNRYINSGIFKQIVSGEYVTMKELYKNIITSNDYGRQVFNCNQFPNLEESTAMYRRLILIEFKVTISETEQDKQLSNKIIKDELAGVLNWVLNGLDRIVKNKSFTNSEEINKNIDEFKNSGSVLSSFLREKCYKKSESNLIAVSDIYKEYQLYFVNAGGMLNKIDMLNKFSQKLNSLGYKSKRKKKGSYYFIEQEQEQEQEEKPF